MSDSHHNPTLKQAGLVMRRVVIRLRNHLLLLILENRTSVRLVLAIYFTTFCIVLPWITRSCPHSVYTRLSHMDKDDVIKMVTEKNRQRSNLASDYLASLHPEMTLHEYKQMLGIHELDLVITVITIGRNYHKQEVNYLSQVMTRLDEQFKMDTEFKKKALFMCNTHAGPGYHVEAMKLANYWPLITRFPNGSVRHSIMNQYNKEKDDLRFCLQEAARYDSRYIMMIQDDALPHPAMFSTLRRVLDLGVERRWHLGTLLDNRNKWGYVKLFYPEKWQGYAYMPERFLELIALGMLGGSASVFLLLVSFRSRRYHHPPRSRIVAFALGAMYVILFAILAGRQCLLEAKQKAGIYVVRNAPECCIPAVVYPWHVVPELLNRLSQTASSKKHPVDITVDKIIADMDLQRYVIEPNLFEHIGYVSSLKGPSRDPLQFI